MTGASVRHNLIATNLVALLHPRARCEGCQLFVSDMKLRVRSGEDTAFYYPDLMLCCDPADTASHWRERPCLVVEVLSESTERVDTREKVHEYRALPSLGAYLILAQDAPRTTRYRRDTGSGPQRVAGDDALLELPCGIGALRLGELYEGLPAT